MEAVLMQLLAGEIIARADAGAARSQLATLLESIPDALLILDREYRFVYLNAKAEQVTQRSREELLGKNIWEMFPEVLDTPFYAAYQRAFSEQVSVHFEAFNALFKGWYDVNIYATADGMSAYFRDISSRKREEREQRILAEAGRLLVSSPLDYEARLANVARMAVPHLADWCVIDTLGEAGTIIRLAVAHVDPTKVALGWEIARRYPTDPNAPFGVPKVLRTGKSELRPAIPDTLLIAASSDTEYLRLIRDLGLTSCIIVPLIAGERKLGAITFVSAESGRHYEEADLLLAEELARLAALAMDNARLYRESQAALERALRLQTIAAALSEASTLASVGSIVLNQGVTVLGANSGLIALLNSDRTLLEIISSVGYSFDAIEKRQCIPLSVPVAIADAARLGEPVWIESPTVRLARYPHLPPSLTPLVFQALAALPLTVEGRTIGVLGMTFQEARRFDKEDRAFLEVLAQQCAQAFERSRLYEAQRKNEERAQYLNLEQQARTRAEAAMRTRQELDYLKDLFVAIATHELRSPVTAIRGYAQLLQRTLSRLPPQQIESRETADAEREHSRHAEKSLLAVETILRQTERMSGLINQLLDLSRIQYGKLELQYTPEADLVELVQRVIEQQRLIAPDHLFRIELAEEPPLVPFDEARLEQVINNLVSNAVKFSLPGTPITVGIERRPTSPSLAEVVVWIKDEGSGIPQEEQEHIFDRFYRVRTKENTRVDGLGLGLYISSEIIQQHGGQMWLESEPGKGSTFWFSLPLKYVPRSEEAEQNSL